ncbi:MRN complex-interacting protein [Chanos chanos]|uniref:MRN complex-interacting protein n=1 Tax=Chanos chanos TaxID=29144 RepID=A0A6J2W4H2_CHACN|nr:MRN complex-interacting protein [Chanos chanos]
MVQEFHVLRCFSCETFQVQQVKKSKKWTCKMCGEKQSVIKEYGRGTGADCRRHVQKLNSLRGNLLEEENQRAWTQWEKEGEYWSEEEHGDEAQTCEQQAEAVAESRWSKYVEQAEKRPSEDEEEEEENVYTERRTFSNWKNIRKRKTGYRTRVGEGHCDGAENKDTESGTGHWMTERQPLQPQSSKGFFSRLSSVEPSLKSSVPHRPKEARTWSAKGNSTSPTVCTDTPVATCCTNPASYGIATEPYSRTATGTGPADVTTKVSSSEFFRGPSGGVSIGHKLSGNKMETKASKWVEPKDMNRFKHERGGPSASVQMGETVGLGNRTGGVLERMSSVVSHCVLGSSTNQTSSPSFTSQSRNHLEKPVCHQPPPVKRPCPTLSFSSLFHTDEDFDDAF